MEETTPNKRKSLANSNVTPNKIQKTDSPVSQNIINQLSNKNGDKSESPNENQNIAPEKQVNGNQTTPNKQINDVEEAAINEADLDENAQVDENESGDKDDLDGEVQVEKDEKADVDQEETNNELENDEFGNLDGEAKHETIDEKDNDVNEKETKNKFSVHVEGLKKNLTMDRIFPGCNIETFKKWKNPKSKKYSENAKVYFKDKESYKKALANQEVNVDDNKIFVNVDYSTIEFSVAVEGLHPDVDVRDIFNDCNILCVSVTRFRTKVKYVNFEDKESMQKALLKCGSEVNGKSISVQPIKQIVERVQNLSIWIHGLNSDVKIEDLFEGCKIKFYFFEPETNTHRLYGVADVTFEDEESVQKALLKHDTECNGSVIKIFRKYCSVTVKGINENTELETLFTDCKIHTVELKVNKATNQLTGAVVHFKDYSSLKKAESVEAPPGVTIFPPKIHRNDGNKSGFMKNKFNKPPFQQARGKVAKKLLRKELKSQVQKLSGEVYGTYRSRPKPFMTNNTYF